MALPNNIEAYVMRTSNETFQTQDCWDSFENITQKCIQTGPNAGAVLGPDADEFFESGFRVLNALVSVHSENGHDFGNNSALEQWCPDTPPLCTSCDGEGYVPLCKS
jgi:hypothetical protein